MRLNSIFFSGLLLVLFFTIASCDEGQKTSFTIKSFDPFVNLQSEITNDTIPLKVDLSDAVIKGIRIPTVNQSPDGKFHFKFKLTNKNDKKRKYFYKIYYHNESYKHEVTKKTMTKPKYNREAAENFYGSWKDVSVGFKETASIGSEKSTEVKDAFRIIGNPRNEKRYFGKSPRSEKLFEIINSIKSNPDWLSKVKKKAKNNNIELEKQLYLDARHTIKNGDKSYNNRWKRNPRMGVYSFLIVVATEKALEELPDYITDISKRNNDSIFMNPYYYFLHGEGSALKNVIAVKADKYLKASTHMVPGNGVFVSFSNNSEPKCYDSLCGPSLDLFRNAHYKHHFNYINKDWPFKNIPVVKDIFKDDYTREEFYANKEKYDDRRVKDYPANPEYSCSTILPDAEENIITLVNPGNKGKEKPKKQQIAIETRIGLTYGKFRGKINFPELINKHNVWNGVTNAFWLFTESRRSWNKRNLCEEGYVAKGGGDKENIQYVDRATYSEIDIEIVKESKYWSKKKKNYDPAKTDNIIVACTNWDLACQDPPSFGEPEMEYGGQDFLLHRWYDTYRALTSKKPVNENEMFQGNHYYYEIGWYPDSIVWKVGPDLDNLKTVGYMDETVTKIPNNQMIMMVSQEFHHGDWWPFTPFHQNNIPYPKKDIKGVIHDMWIE